MEISDSIRRVAPTQDLACVRCGKPTAINRVFFAEDAVETVGYRCLSCGFEETRSAAPTAHIS